MADREKDAGKYSGDDLLLLAQQYIIDCRECPSGEMPGGGGKKARGKGEGGRFPNVAGFCRYLGVSSRKYSELSELYPEEAGCITAVFEDEALNSEIPATLLGAYLKARLGYAEARPEKKPEDGEGELKVVFLHDIMADGK